MYPCTPATVMEAPPAPAAVEPEMVEEPAAAVEPPKALTSSASSKGTTFIKVRPVQVDILSCLTPRGAS